MSIASSLAFMESSLYGLMMLQQPQGCQWWSCLKNPDSQILDSWSETGNCCNLRFCDDLSQSPNLWFQADYVHPLLPPKSWAGTGIAIIPFRCLQVQKWKWQPQRSATSKLDLRDVLSPGWDLPRSFLVTDQWPLMSGLSHDVTLRYWWSVV